MIKQTICKNCKRPFWTRGNTAKYCSPDCRKNRKASVVKTSNNGASIRLQDSDRNTGIW